MVRIASAALSAVHRSGMHASSHVVAQEAGCSGAVSLSKHCRQADDVWPSGTWLPSDQDRESSWQPSAGLLAAWHCDDVDD